MQTVADPTLTVRPLARGDLDAVVDIDAAIERRTRRAYIQRRLAAALRQPAQHTQFAAVDASGLAGYILGRVLTGEFGRPAPSLRLELVGVRPDAKGHRVGELLLAALSDWARRHAVQELRTAAAWNDHAMLHWLDVNGFRLAPGQVLESTRESFAHAAERHDALELTEGRGPGNEIDYGAPEANDFERVARDGNEVRTMQRDDLAEIVRIDRAITGRDRGGYIGNKLAEALDDSAIRVSLAARRDGAIVGYLMAAADLGDFGRTEPVAVIDTIGVDPDYEHRGVGRALLAELLTNLAALRIETVETVVAPGEHALLAFFHDAGFVPAQRLTFVKQLHR